MYFVIVGAGIIGASLARWLVASNHEVAVIDTNQARCAAIDDELGSVSVLGDGTEVGVLSKAGVNRAATLIALTGDDDVNLVACQVARHLFN
ncbi:MAG: NAD-binding protein, partial [Ardenticatenaceae bacterium]